MASLGGRNGKTSKGQNWNIIQDEYTNLDQWTEYTITYRVLKCNRGHAAAASGLAAPPKQARRACRTPADQISRDSLYIRQEPPPTLLKHYLRRLAADD
ncbi:hypothetical protein HZ326_20022 [Fusarium oxysporum f. sp. albedinis]|nr:hypothetical protein HZ326_20022 [Fusarium oxysporum f. sp. albedinis]